jgi:MerR family copper efflux transcriptional regulator
MIRLYEQIGLIQSSDSTRGNYRSFSAGEIADLKFVKPARVSGFSLREITELLSLWRDRARPGWEVKAIAERHAADLQARISEIGLIATRLTALAQCCDEEDRSRSPALLASPPET